MALLRIAAAAAAVALAAPASAFSPAALQTRSAARPAAASSTSLRDIIKGEADAAIALVHRFGADGLALDDVVEGGR